MGDTRTNTFSALGLSSQHLSAASGTLFDDRAKAAADTLKAGSSPKAARSDEDIDRAARQFEALLLQQMMKSMWQTVPTSGLLSGGREQEHYREMLVESLAEEISGGQGIGIKEVIVRDLKKFEKR